MTGGRAIALVGLLAAASGLLVTCTLNPGGSSSARGHAPADRRTPAPVDRPVEVAARASDDAPRSVDEQAPPEGDAPAEPAVTGYRVTARTTIVYPEPRWGTPLRGRIDPNTAFAIRGLVDPAQADECEGEGWARVDGGGFVCLKPHHEETAEAPAIQPVVPEGQVVPFIYAMPHQDRAGKLAAPVPRYRNKWGLLRGREPLDHLVGNRQYSFVTEDRSTSVGRYLVDKKERVVRSSHMKKERPSEFGGRPLAERPLVEGLAAGWIVRYRVELRDKPHPTRSKVVKKLEHHVELDVDPERHRAKGEAYYAVPDAIAPGVPGYLSDRDVHLWIPGPPLAEVGDDELWIDVELGQQTLAIMRGQDPEYVTLISSGNGKHPTPRGLYRLRSKLGLGKMRSLPDSPSDEEYYVEDVPWVQYFYKRYALHTSYWHNRFGWRHSHGCINLAPRDSSYLFSQTAPALPEGWISVHENDGDPGTLLRVRRGKEPVEDRRRPLSEVDPEDDELAEGIDDGDGGGGDE